MIEYYKEKLTFYRLLLTLAITAFSGCIAWIFTQYPNYTILQAFFDIIAVLCLGILIIKTISTIILYQVKLMRSLK